MRSCCLIILCGILAATQTGCVTLPVFAVEGVKSALSVVRPVARKDGTVNLIGARFGTVGAGVWAGRVDDNLNPSERQRLNDIEAWVNQIESERALELAPDK